MIKYQLERIKDMYSGISDPDRLDGIPVVTVAQSDIDWLIEQAERVQELENHNKRYREALEFYADENNYREQELKGIVPPRPITFKPILHDYGSIARQALEGEE